MPLMFNGSVMKVGNSFAVVLPKPLVENFGIMKGDSMKMIVTDKGIYIPLTQKGQSQNKEVEKMIKEMRK